MDGSPGQDMAVGRGWFSSTTEADYLGLGCAARLWHCSGEGPQEKASEQQCWDLIGQESQHRHPECSKQ